MHRAQIFILGTAGALAAIGYLLVALNKDSLGAVSLTTYIGIVVMAVSMKISGYLITGPRHAIEGKQYGDVMDWAMLLFVWPSYVTPLIVCADAAGTPNGSILSLRFCIQCRL